MRKIMKIFSKKAQKREKNQKKAQKREKNQKKALFH